MWALLEIPFFPMFAIYILQTEGGKDDGGYTRSVPLYDILISVDDG